MALPIVWLVASCVGVAGYNFNIIRNGVCNHPAGPEFNETSTWSAMLDKWTCIPNPANYPAQSVSAVLVNLIPSLSVPVPVFAVYAGMGALGWSWSLVTPKSEDADDFLVLGPHGAACEGEGIDEQAGTPDELASHRLICRLHSRLANISAALAPGSAQAGPTPPPTLFEVLGLDATAPPFFPPSASTMQGIMNSAPDYYRMTEAAKTAVADAYAVKAGPILEARVHTQQTGDLPDAKFEKISKRYLALLSEIASALMDDWTRSFYQNKFIPRLMGGNPSTPLEKAAGQRRARELKQLCPCY